MDNWMIRFTLIFLNVMSLCYADPIPDPDPHSIILQVNQVVENNQCCEDGCRRGDTEYPNGFILSGICMTECCTDGDWITTWTNLQCCVFNDTLYPIGYNLTDVCLELQCTIDGWIFIGINWLCGICQVYGEPHIKPFNWPWSFPYSITGSHVLSQAGILPPSVFGVDAMFFMFGISPMWPPFISTAVGSIRYYEDDISIEVIFAHPFWPPAIEVWVQIDGVPEKLTLPAVVERRVVVLEYYSWFSLNCIIIVGTKGISVSVCQHGFSPAFVAVWAMPSLQYQLYGLCDIWLGNGYSLSYYTMRNGSTTTDTDIFGESWKIDDGPPSNYTPPAIDRCSNVTVTSEIEDTCNDITKGVCEISELRCADFNQSCQSDLCHVPDYDSYVEGFTSFMLLINNLFQLP